MTTLEKIEQLKKVLPSNANLSWEEVQTGEYSYSQSLVITIRPGISCEHEDIGTEWSNQQCSVCATMMPNAF